MKCKKCGEKIKKESLYCDKCGNEIVEVTKRKINKKAILGIIILIIIIVSGTIIFSYNKIQVSQINVAGNTSSNINNNGIATIQGDWMYYEMGTSIYKMKTNESEKTELTHDSGAYNGYLNVIGDWIYYANISSTTVHSSNGNILTAKYSIYKMKIDGSGKTELTNGTILNYLRVVNDWIYYSYKDIKTKEYSIYRMKIDGSDKTKITNDSEKLYSEMNIAGDWIYYYEVNQASRISNLYRIKTDGSQKSIA